MRSKPAIRVARFLRIASAGIVFGCSETVAPSASSITVSPATDTLLAGSSVQLRATVYDQQGKPIESPITWSSSDTAVATVDDSGFVRARAQGTTIIDATSNGVVGHAELLVQALALEGIWDYTQEILGGHYGPTCSDTGSIDLAQQNATTVHGMGARKGTCTAEVRIVTGVLQDSVNGTVSGDSVAFEFASCFYRAHVIGDPPDSLIGSVSCPTGADTGWVGSPYYGEWRAGSKHPVDSVALRPSAAIVPYGLSLTLDPVVTDEAGQQLFWRSVAWVSEAIDVVHVSNQGLVTALGGGNAAVTATVEGKTGSADIQVVVIDFAKIAAGKSHTCGLDVDGVAYCWGLALGGQYITRPQPISTPVRFDTLVTGEWHTCGLSGGEAWCWGANWGQLGDGTTTQRTEPVRVTGGHLFVTITAGYAHTCGLTPAGEAYCWGDNNRGQLGDSSRTNRTEPVAVRGGITFSQLSGDQVHTCGLTATGELYCWGNNGEGEFGNGSQLDSTVPVRAGGSMIFVAFSPGATHGCGLTAGLTAYCWGSNFSGQLGIGTSGDGVRTSPVPVAGGWTFRSLEAGGGGVCGVRPDDVAMCWGYNAVGAVGDSTTVTNRVVPTVVAGGHRWAVVLAGTPGATCGFDSQGTAWCWGANGEGEIGDDTTIWRTYPVRVAGQP